MSSFHSLGIGLAMALIAPAVGQAQGAPAQPAPSDSAIEAPPLVTPALAARVAPIKWTYVTTLAMGEGTPQRIGFRTLTVADAMFQGAPAWLVIDSRQMHTVTYAESLFVSKRDLSPMVQVRHTPTGTVVSRYAADSVRTTFDDDSAHGTVAMPNQPGLLANLYLLEALLGADSLHAGWATSAHLAAITPQQSGVVPLDTRVVGEEKTMIPDGAFDAWVVALQIGSSQEKIWVRKSDGVVIKEELPVVGMGGATVQVILGLHGVGEAGSGKGKAGAAAP